MSKKYSMISILCMVMVLVLLGMAAAEIASGTSGDLTWTLSDDGVLTISGEGELSWNKYNAPWKEYVDDIVSVIICEGVTNNYSDSGLFFDYSNLEEIIIPNSFTMIHDCDFGYCSKLQSINIPSSVKEISKNAFPGCLSLTNISVDPDNPYFVSSDGIVYNKEKTKIIVVSTGKEEIVIPSSVVSIGEYNFCECRNLKHIEIPDNINEIGMGAFMGCDSLTDISLPAGLTKIGDSAFRECTNLKKIVIPANVTLIDNLVFAGCSSLTNITVDINNQQYSSIDGVLYNKEKTEIICVPAGKDKIEIPDSVTNIRMFAFLGCSNFTSIEIPDSVTSIGAMAFNHCDGLRNIKIPNSVTYIESFAFEDCSSLTSIKIPDSVTSIESFVFCRCSSLTSVEIPASVKNIGWRAFLDCRSQMSVYFYGSNIPDINSGAFQTNTITAYYPSTWSETPTEQYGGTVTWVPVDAPTIITRPESITEVEGSVAEFVVAAEGIGLSYQWQVSTDGGNTWNNSGLSGNKTDKLKVVATMARNEYRFRCVVTDCVGRSKTSGKAWLYVIEDNFDVNETYHAYIYFQTPKYSFRQPWDDNNQYGIGYADESNMDYFYQVTGWDEDNNAKILPGSFVDAEISGDGVYTVSVTGLDFDENELIDTWSDTNGFNLLGVSTDIPATNKIVIDNVQMNINGDNIEVHPQIIKVNDKYYIEIRVQNIWDNSVDAPVYSVENISEINISFEVSGYGFDKNDDKPVITKQPRSCYVMRGKDAVFNVTASGEGLTYRWQISTDGGITWRDSDFEGYDQATLLVPVIDERNGYWFRCKVTDNAGNTSVSSKAMLTVAKDIIKIIERPKDTVAAAGTTVRFSVVANTTYGSDINYQWYVSTDGGENWNKSSLSGNKTSVLEVKATQARNGYMFKCYLNELGAITRPVTLTIGQPLKITSQPSNSLTAENANAVFSVSAESLNEGNLSYQWQVSTDGGKTWKNSGLAGNKTNMLTVSATEARNAYFFRCVITDYAGNTLVSSKAMLTVAKDKIIIVEAPKDIVAAVGTTVRFSVVANTIDGSDISYQWYVSTDEGKNWNILSLSGNKTSTLEVKATQVRDGYMFKCYLNELGVTRPVTLTIGQPLTITSQPSNSLIAENANAVFSVSAESLNEGNLSYQWQVSTDGGDTWKNSGLTGNKTNKLTVKGTADRNGYIFRCVITDCIGQTITSDAAKLTVGEEEAIIISTQPKKATADEGKNAVFTVSVSSSTGSELSFQWQASTDAGKTWSNSGLSGNKTATLAVDATTARNGYQFRCIVSDAAGNTLTSNAATLTVKSYIKFNSQPLSQKVTNATKVKFKVSAESLTGSSLSYQWQVSTDGGKTWKNSGLSGNKTAILVVDATAARSGYRFRCVVTDANGKSLTSSAAVMTVKKVADKAVTITSFTASQTALAGTNVKFNVGAKSSTGTALTYQWQVSTDGGKTFNNTGLTGNRTATLTVAATTGRNNYQFRCIVSDKNSNSVVSDSVRLVVK